MLTWLRRGHGYGYILGYIFVPVSRSHGVSGAK